MSDEKKGPDYLDFLEGLDTHELEALLDGKASAAVASAADGYDLVADIIAAEKVEPGSGEAPWMEVLAKLSTQDEAVQVVADLEHLRALVGVMANRAVKRLRDLHRETCEECRKKDAEGDKLRRGLNAAKQAFLEALADDSPEEGDEPWRASLPPEPEL